MVLAERDIPIDVENLQSLNVPMDLLHRLLRSLKEGEINAETVRSPPTSRVGGIRREKNLEGFAARGHLRVDSNPRAT